MLFSFLVLCEITCGIRTGSSSLLFNVFALRLKGELCSFSLISLLCFVVLFKLRLLFAFLVESETTSGMGAAGYNFLLNVLTLDLKREVLLYSFVFLFPYFRFWAFCLFAVFAALLFGCEACQSCSAG